MSYRSLTDARKVTGDDGFARGQTRIWYWKPEYSRDYLMGYQWLRDEGIPVPDVKTIGRTHVKVGAIQEDRPERVYMMMQGDYWSPNGEARPLIEKLGLSHTSMSVGDVLQMADGRLLMVDRMGFAELSRGSNPAGRAERRRPLRQLVDAAEQELRTAQASTDPINTVREAVLAAYYAGAAIQLARQESSASMLDRAHTVFFRAYMLAQQACGARGEDVEARYAPNPRESIAAISRKFAERKKREHAVRDARRDLAAAAGSEHPSRRVHHAVEAATHAGAAWALGARKSGDRLRDEAHQLAQSALAMGSPYRNNPFVRRHESVEPVLTFAYPELHKYRGWELEVSPWPPDRPTEWMAKGKKGAEEMHVFSEVGKGPAIKALKIAIDLEDEGDDAVIFWEWLEEFIPEVRPKAAITRPELARRIELARRELSGRPAGAQEELGPAFRWFYDQPIDYRVQFIDRAIEYNELREGPHAPPGVPRRGRPQARPNPQARSRLKRRLLR